MRNKFLLLPIRFFICSDKDNVTNFLLRNLIFYIADEVSDSTEVLDFVLNCCSEFWNVYTKSSCCIFGLQSSYKAALLFDKKQYFFCMRKDTERKSSSQRWETLLFLSTLNMSAVTSVQSALAYAIRVNPIVMSAAVWYLIAHKCANICARGNILTIKFRTSEIIAEWLFVSSREVERLLYLFLRYFRLKSINAFVRPFDHFEVDYALLLLALPGIIILFGMSSTVRVKPLNICLCTSLQQKPKSKQTVK